MPNHEKFYQSAKPGSGTASVMAEVLSHANEGMWQACQNGNRILVEVAIESGCDVNYSSGGVSCLSVAAMQGQRNCRSAVNGWC
jgi:hypothetical protein